MACCRNERHHKDETKRYCPRCSNRIEPIDVHGHEQCPACKSNINDCCQGEVKNEPVSINEHS